MAGVRVFNFFADEEIGFWKLKYGLFREFQKEGVQGPVLIFFDAEWIPGSPGRLCD